LDWLSRLAGWVGWLVGLAEARPPGVSKNVGLRAL
jgi:hypothetical protein